MTRSDVVKGGMLLGSEFCFLHFLTGFGPLSLRLQYGAVNRSISETEYNFGADLAGLRIRKKKERQKKK